MPKIFSIKVGAGIPVLPGICADHYHEVRELRLAMQKEVDAVKAREAELREFIINTLSATDETGAAGEKYRAQITRDTKPSATDWEKIYDYIVENDRFDLLNKALSITAIKELWEAGEKIPGVSKVHVKSLSITKI